MIYSPRALRNISLRNFKARVRCRRSLTSDNIPEYKSFSPILDYASIFRRKEEIQENLNHRALEVDLNSAEKLYKEKLSLEKTLNSLRKQHNASSKDFSSLKKEGKDIENTKEIKRIIQDLKSKLDSKQQLLYEIARDIPNYLHPQTPLGDSPRVINEVGNKVESHFPTGKKRLSYVQLTELHDIADFERGGKVSGKGFFYMKNAGALLEQALINYVLRKCIKNKFKIVFPPAAIRREVTNACGFNPRSSDTHIYEVNSGPKSGSKRLDLCATAEFPLNAINSNEVLRKSDLPIMLAGVSPCFRAEGLAGAQNRGLYRVHQFTKVEMVLMVEGSKSEKYLEKLLEIQQDIFSDLGLCYRVLSINSRDMGAPAYQKYDIEAWLPSRNSWGEITSASNCTDYQSRRLNIRYFSNGENKATDFVHTLNGTACAIPRTIVAILEQNQDENGDVDIPEVLREPLEYLINSATSITKISQLRSMA